jgi:hypothetical protein
MREHLSQRCVDGIKGGRQMLIKPLIGQLAQGQGKLILANTEQLHQKLEVMSSRIRALEHALQDLHARISRQIHPLLTPELLMIKSAFGLFEGEQAPKTSQDEPTSSTRDAESVASIDADGTFVSRDTGAPAFFGASAGAEVSGCSQLGKLLTRVLFSEFLT